MSALHIHPEGVIWFDPAVNHYDPLPLGPEDGSYLSLSQQPPLWTTSVPEGLTVANGQPMLYGDASYLYTGDPISPGTCSTIHQSDRLSDGPEASNTGVAAWSTTSSAYEQPYFPYHASSNALFASSPFTADPDDAILQAEAATNELNGTIARAERRRKKALERNRIAADKFRRHQKQNVHKLEVSKDKLEKEHMRLKTDISNLSDQVIELKNELMTHGRCCDLNIDRWMKTQARNFSQTLIVNDEEALLSTTADLTVACPCHAPRHGT